jgi:hypothetical protein
MNIAKRKRMSAYKKRAVLLVASAAMALSLVLAPAAGAITVGGSSDCDGNAVIKCGAHSTGALISAYNSSAYVQKVFAFFGISAVDMADLPKTDVAGRVTKDGKVFIEGQSRPVATGAVTGGRQDMPGSNKVVFRGAVFFTRPPSVSFQQESLPVFVSMKNGMFQFAVIASCGNAVRATPTKQAPPPQAAVAPAKPVSKSQPQPEKPKPAPAPAPSQTQTQQQQQAVTQNTTQNQEVTVNNTTTPPTPPSEVAGIPASSAPETVAAAPEQETGKASLPNVGPGSAAGTAGAFFGSMTLGVLGYRRYLIHILVG